MKKTFVVLIFFIFNGTFACNSVNMAIDIAANKNSFAMVYFYSSDKSSIEDFTTYFNLDKKDIDVVSSYYIYDADMFRNRFESRKYNVTVFPTIIIYDGNGVELVRIENDKKTPIDVKPILENFVFVDKIFGNDIKNFHESKVFNSAIRVVQKYYDYSLLVSDKYKPNVYSAIDNYTIQAEKYLKKDKDNFELNNEKLSLIKLYKLAFTKDFITLNDKLNTFDTAKLNDSNKQYYYFLKYVSSKALQNNNIVSMENIVDKLSGFDEYIKKSELILANTN